MISMRQYAASPRIKQLITYNTEYFSASWVDEFYNVVWNVDTAQGFGLDIWGRIVGLEGGRYLQVDAGFYLGFYSDTTPAWGTFNNGTLFNGKKDTDTFKLEDSAFRLLILAKALTNISDCTVPSLNRMLKALFPGRGRCWVNDLQGMEIRYPFEFELMPWERSIINSDSLPRPGGVLVSVAEIPLETLGFSEAESPGGYDYDPFDQGVFYNA